MRLRDAYALREAAARRSLERIRSDRRGALVDVGRALDWLAEHLFDSELTVKSLRRDCQLRDNSFSLRFRQHCRQPPAGYIRERRLETAEVLLVTSRLTASQIAEILGFSTLQVFSDTFERWAKIRPSAYRKLAQRMPSAVREELLNAETLRLVSVGKLDADVAHRLMAHLQDLYGSAATTTPARQAVAAAIPQEEEDFAAGFWRQMKDLPFFQQRVLVLGFPLRSAALFHLLRRQSRLTGRQDRQRGIELAALAIASLYSAAGYLAPKRLLDLLVLGWSWLGNAQRLALDFAQAERSFRIAAWHLATPEADRAIMAEHLELLASLRWYQRKLDEAVVLQDRAVHLQRTIGDPDALAKALIVRGIIGGYARTAQNWNTDLEEAMQLLDHEKQPYLSLVAHIRLALGHFFAEEYQAAQRLLPKIQTLASKFPDTSAMLRMKWLQGLLYQAHRDGATAVHLLKQVFEDFSAAKDAGHMAMAGIDLAAVLLEERSFAMARSVCLEILPCFQALQHHETFGEALSLLQQALSGEQLEAALLYEIQQRLWILHQDPPDSGL